MLRFIFAFIFFGLLFYGMYLYTPDAFNLLHSWAASIFDFVKHIVHQFAPAKAAVTPAG